MNPFHGRGDCSMLSAPWRWHMRTIIIAATLLAGIAIAKEPRPEYDWRLDQYFECADAQIDRLKHSTDSTEAILTTVLLACENEKRGVIQLGIRLYEIENRTRLVGASRTRFQNEGEDRIRELTTARIVTTRAR